MTGSTGRRRSINRRACLQAGALSLLGLTSDQLRQLRIAAAESGRPSKVPSANSCVFIFLFGGPSHIDLWDMKPEAPLEIRGEFQPVETKVPGIHLCEHLPMLAAQMDKFCLLRSMTHHMPVHGPACSQIYSGREYFGPPITDQALPQDWPSIAALVQRFGPRPGGHPNSIVLPWYTQFVGQDRRIAGQSGGRMGEQYNPLLIEGNPTREDFEVQGLKFPAGITSARFERRRDLLDELRVSEQERLQRTELSRLLDLQYGTALSIVGESPFTRAFDLHREAVTTREDYGQTRIGQSLLLARRLVEAGVSLVTVNWDDDHKDDKVSPHWDTHDNNFPKLKDRLCPPFDRALATFLADLETRGLLETTLVVALGEFGRTPKVGAVTQNGMTQATGRDHWPHAFTALLAGGGVRGGQIYGSTVASGGYVKDDPVSPADLAATIFKHLGIDRVQEYDDQFLQIRQVLSEGRPIPNLG